MAEGDWEAWNTLMVGLIYTGGFPEHLITLP